jgi:ketosteroid isomerase-like protein
MERPADPEVERVLTAVEALWAAYEAASVEYFDRFTADASFFTPGWGTRLRGRDAYRRCFGPYLGTHRRAAHLLHPEVRLLGGGAALVTCHARFRANYHSSDHCLSLLVVPDGEDLKIAHMHMSSLTGFSATGTSGLVEEITALQVTARPASAGRE